jgi:lipopolysaccharide transport system ATP-binding protein
MLRDTLMQFARAPLAALRRPNYESFWALENVSLEVREQEVLGLIGRNGAGKTTLLRILSRITRPTTGHAEIRGHVRSLLEVGTGFHGELTGRENTYFSGSLLGMKKREIDRKLDEIVAFAEIEKFIDTPVKHYSSGMYVRLAFAVAAHLEPEILLVDEVLAVGDINFQKKCLGKMGDVARQGRTVVLVSHQMNQIRRLCHRVAWIDGGHMRMNGATHEVVSAYESAMTNGDRGGHRPGQGNGSKGRWIGWGISEPQGSTNTLNDFGPVTVRFSLEVYERLQRAHHGIALFNSDGQVIWGWAAYDVALVPGAHEFTYAFPMLPLRPGPYTWRVSLYDDDSELVDYIDCLPQMIVALDSLSHPRDEWAGVLNIPSQLKISQKVEPLT